MSTPEARIAERVRDAREAAGLSQEAAAQTLGIALRTYARWERQESFGYLLRLDEISKAFGISTQELLGDEELPTPSKDSFTAKLDLLLDEVRQIREDLDGLKRPRPRR